MSTEEYVVIDPYQNVGQPRRLHFSGQVCQAEGIIEVPKGEQTRVRGDPRPVEFQLQARIERDPESGSALITRCTVHLQPR